MEEIKNPGRVAMERLTYWNEELGCWSYRCASGDAAKRLAAYENSGLEPVEIANIARCFECRYSIEDTETYSWYCPINHNYHRENEFCSMGKRRNVVE